MEIIRKVVAVAAINLHGKYSSWFRQVMRRDEGHLCMIKGTRLKARSKMRWLDKIEENLRRVSALARGGQERMRWRSKTAVPDPLPEP